MKNNSKFEISFRCTIDNTIHGLRVIAQNMEQAIKFATEDMQNLLYCNKSDLRVLKKLSFELE